jgi:hypothetical protein
MLTLKNNASSGVEYNLDSCGGTSLFPGALLFEAAKSENAAIAVVNPYGFAFGQATVPSDHPTSGFVKIANGGYLGINTDYWMRNGGAGTAGGDGIGGVTGAAACSPLSVSTASNIRSAQIWQESNFGSGQSTALYVDNSVSSTDEKIAIAVVVDHGVGNYVLIGQNATGGAVFSGGVTATGTPVVIDNTGAMVLGTGLANKGGGTLNVGTGIYRGGTAYTNPGYVFEHAVKGKLERFAEAAGAEDYRGLRPLSEIEEIVTTEFELPLLLRHPGGDLFQRGEDMLASLEEAYLYIFEVARRLTHVEDLLNVTELGRTVSAM